MEDLPVRVLTWFYRRLGRFYPVVLVGVVLQSGWFIAAGTLGLYTFYYDYDKADFLFLVAVTAVLVGLTLAVALVDVHRRARPLRRWIVGERDPESTERAWATAAGFPLALIKRQMPLPILGVAVPASIVAVVVLNLSWPAFFPIFASALVAIGYSAILLLFTIEGGMRPVLIDINRTVSPRLRKDAAGLPLRFKLMAALPLINIITGLTVAALTSEGGGGASLGFDVLAALTVAFTISFELTVLLSKSILRPIQDLMRATEEVAHGRYDAHVPITTTDELGDLSAAFNQMVEGLAERERIREAFGTYLDQEIAEYILSEGYSPEGVELEVTLLFCDVRDFTGFAAKASPTEVVANLNALFEQVVPIIAHHGGHVEKFIGDGLVAVFGAPERFPDHADRAVRAGVEMAQRINRSRGDDGASPARAFQIGVGVNSGKVVAGSIGGGGRLNFSVIGDAVNMASRVEAATRELDHDVLITAATRDRLSETIEVVECGKRPLKGYDEPAELYAPIVGAPAKRVLGGDGVAETIGPRTAAPGQPLRTLPGP